MASIVLFYGGRRIYRRAWAGITSAAFGMETLITIGAFSAYLYSTYQLLSGSIHLYYDTASMLIVLVTLGKLLESRAKAQVQEGLESLFSLRPSKVRIVAPGQDQGRYVSAEQLGKGDLFQVEAERDCPGRRKSPGRERQALMNPLSPARRFLSPKVRVMTFGAESG